MLKAVYTLSGFKCLKSTAVFKLGSSLHRLTVETSNAERSRGMVPWCFTPVVSLASLPLCNGASDDNTTPSGCQVESHCYIYHFVTPHQSLETPGGAFKRPGSQLYIKVLETPGGGAFKRPGSQLYIKVLESPGGGAFKRPGLSPCTPPASLAVGEEAHGVVRLAPLLRLPVVGIRRGSRRVGVQVEHI